MYLIVGIVLCRISRIEYFRSTTVVTTYQILLWYQLLLLPLVVV